MIAPPEVVVLDEVFDDLSDGRRFYARNELWLGEYFWDSLLSDIESLYLYAGAHPRHFGLYKLIARRFPYAIYYDIKGAAVVVFAVLPMRRDPSWIKKTIAGRS
ncbi:type II toxin-antitoxin system RelE/ParE family toxin [Chlorobaculum sp. 24CR]|uniref:type II toxin-antitoxin system RelE/ParE family toxin n=1 Tax=Chlorobaculum sp. 24CR TaxID=2508878 RepID=UPI00100B4420|nr:type II toxin-antitoxin system RelE/ParE family toxin [Chlorobaculum sp. 24CR]RXK88789.1 type II toxin-antitoxin system RelE/ParE family toxin [Chlorobaculum sp. 24CR]